MASFSSFSILLFALALGSANALALKTAPKLTSNPILKIGDSPQDTKIRTGDRLELRCSVITTPMASIYWTKDGERVQGETAPDVTDLIANEGKDVGVTANMDSVFVVPCATEDDAGTYVCHATNNRETVKAEAEVVVEGAHSKHCKHHHRHPAPVITFWSSLRFERLGNTVVLTCRSDSSVHWEADGEPIEDPRISQLTNGDLQIEGVVKEDQKEYTCVANNEYGEHAVEVYLYVTEKKKKH
ncbi:unnamed protein product [Caenorhabditis sp. 36 PRJEB53466]|nr:unnamed protein product [Caenorhabditis sp. 36 PRJEB53466]